MLKNRCACWGQTLAGQMIELVLIADFGIDRADGDKGGVRSLRLKLAPDAHRGNEHIDAPRLDVL